MVKDLSVTREEIDKVDKQIVKLLEERMELAMDVAAYKRSTGKAIYDRDRELQKLASLGALASTNLIRKWFRKSFFKLCRLQDVTSTALSEIRNVQLMSCFQKWMSFLFLRTPK